MNRVSPEERLELGRRIINETRAATLGLIAVEFSVVDEFISPSKEELGLPIVSEARHDNLKQMLYPRAVVLGLDTEVVDDFVDFSSSLLIRHQQRLRRDP